MNGGKGDDLMVGTEGDNVIIAISGRDYIGLGYGDGNDNNRGKRRNGKT